MPAFPVSNETGPGVQTRCARKYLGILVPRYLFPADYVPSAGNLEPFRPDHPNEEPHSVTLAVLKQDANASIRWADKSDVPNGPRDDPQPLLPKWGVPLDACGGFKA